ncbi:filamin-C-like [Planoprotostelium fungivorum]|uniref:Filamin-C-like n=1 Tax=Planoprotostelium fungivorum TaxID=1890364 RepID=A0A2P6NXP6_9EUKA|nr:filamin-C-like [Planoprotostelium fungivorum]
MGRRLENGGGGKSPHAPTSPDLHHEYRKKIGTQENKKNTKIRTALRNSIERKKKVEKNFVYFYPVVSALVLLQTKRSGNRNHTLFYRFRQPTADRMGEPDWVRIQGNTFRNWVNTRLRARNIKIDKFHPELLLQPLNKQLLFNRTASSDGTTLIALAEVLTGKPMPKHATKPKMRSQSLDNMSICMKFLKDAGVKMVNIGVEDVVDGNNKIILGLIWMLILRFQMEDEAGKGVRKGLIEWCSTVMPRDSISNFTSDWHSGVAIMKIIDALQPNVVPDYNAHHQMTPLERSTWAAHYAEENMGIPSLLLPEDFINPAVDEQSIMTYLAGFRDWANRNWSPPKEDPFSDSASTVSVDNGEVKVQAKDNAGKEAVEGGAQLEVTVQYVGEDGKEETVTAEVVDHGDGKYTAKFEENPEKKTIIHVKREGKNVGSSPITIQPASPTAEQSTANISSNEIEIQSRSTTGLPSSIGGNKFQAQMEQNGKVTEIPLKEEGGGRLRASFDVEDKSSDAVVTVTYDGKTVGQPQKIEATKASASQSKATVSHDQVKVEAITGSGNSASLGNEGFKATVEQNGKITEIPLKEESEGHLHGTYDIEDKSSDAVVTVTYDGKTVGQPQKIKALRASASRSKALITRNEVEVNALTGSGDAVTEGNDGFKATVEQNGKVTEISMKDDGSGKLRGTYDVEDKTVDAVVTVTLDGKEISKEKIKAAEPPAAHFDTQVKGSNVTVKAKTSEGGAAEHSEKVLEAYIVREGVTTPIHLQHSGDGVYNAEFPQNIRQETVVHVKHKGEYVNGFPHTIAAQKAALDNEKTRVNVDVDKVKMNLGGQKVEVFLERSGRDSLQIPVTDHGDGTYTSHKLPTPSQADAVVTVKIDGKEAGQPVTYKKSEKADPVRTEVKVKEGTLTVTPLTQEGNKANIIEGGHVTPVDLQSDGEGNFSGKFEAKEQKADLEVLVDGRHTDGSPYPIYNPPKISSEQFDPLSSTVRVEGDKIYVSAKRRNGSPATGVNTMQAKVQQKNDVVLIRLKEEGEGSYSADLTQDPYQPSVIYVTSEGETVGHPVNLDAKERPPRSADHTTSKIRFDKEYVEVTAVDDLGRPVVDEGEVKVMVRGKEGQATKLDVRHIGEGVYHADYPKDNQGSYTIDVYLAGKSASSKRIRVGATPSNSPPITPRSAPPAEPKPEPKPEPEPEPEPEPAVVEPEISTKDEVEEPATLSITQVILGQNNFCITKTGEKTNSEETEESEVYTVEIEGPLDTPESRTRDIPVKRYPDGSYRAAEEYQLPEGKYNVHVKRDGNPVENSPFPFVAEAKTSTRRAAWLQHRDSYARYKVGEAEMPPHFLMVYYPRQGRILWYNMPFGKVEELSESVQLTPEANPALKRDLQRLVPTTGRTVLFYSNKNGEVVHSQIIGNRQLGSPQIIKDLTNKRWKHIIPLDVDGEPYVLFYERDAGTVQLRKPNGSELELVSQSKWSGSYERITPVEIEGRTALYLYNHHKRFADVCFLDKECNLEKAYKVTRLSKKWKFVIGLTPGHLLLHEKKSGIGQIVAVGKDTSKVVKEIKGLKKTWTQCEYVAHNRQVVFFGSKSGQAVFMDWDPIQLSLKTAFEVNNWNGAKYVTLGY